MINVTSISVRSYDLDHLDVFWELDSFDNERIEEYDFFVLRSVDGMGGPFHVIAGPFYNTFKFRDGNVHRLHKWRDYYYKIRIVNRATQESREFGPQWLQAPPDRLALEIRRRENLLFKEFAGRVVFHYPRLTFGQRCRKCWDQGARGNTMGREIQQNCATCFDTTFVGGYAKPMALHIQIDPTPITPQRTDLKEHQFVETTARTTMFPPVQPKDMLVEAENVRWLVKSVSYTEKHRAKIRQELTLRQVSRDSIRYAVPVNYDLLAEHTAPRNFTRPMSLQNRPAPPVDDKLGSS